MAVAGGEMAARVAAFDWSATPLGPAEHWPQSLRTAVDLMLGSGFASGILYGPSLTLLYNDAFAAMLGARHPGALGRPADEAFPESAVYRAGVLERVWRGESVMAHDDAFPLERDGDPQTIFLTVTHVPLRDETGAVIAIFVTALETSGRKRAQMRDLFRVRLADALRTLSTPRDLQLAATRALGTLLGAQRVQYGVIAGTDAIIQAEYTDGLPPTIGRHDMRAYGPEVLSTYRAGRAAVCDDTRSAPFTPSVLATLDAAGIRAYASVPVLKQGELVALMVAGSSTPRRWRPDEIALIGETADRTWAAVERARAVDELRDADRRKDEFLAMLAHELRNPLAPLRTAVGVLRLPDVPRETHEELTSIMQRQLDHMVRLVDDLLDVSRITRDKITLQKAAVTLGEIVQIAIDANRPAIDERTIALGVAVHEPGLALDVDATRIVQVLSNVIHNACKFTLPGGEIRIATRTHAAMLVITIADTGEGIEPDLLPHVFELFAQGGDGERSGLGIGLALARRLVEMHGGRIEARSPGRGRGTEVEIRLPITRPAPVARAASPTPASEPGALRVVIIDDNRDAANATGMLVQALGGDPVVAYDGLSGLDRIREVRPELVLLDIGMPGIDGYETCRRIRAEHGAAIRVVAVTGWGQPSDRERALEAGFDAHVTKPADPAVIRALLIRPDGG